MKIASFNHLETPCIQTLHITSIDDKITEDNKSEFVLLNTDSDSINTVGEAVATAIKENTSGVNLEIDNDLNQSLLLEVILLALTDVNIFKSTYTPPKQYEVHLADNLMNLYSTAFANAKAYHMARMLNHLPYSLCNPQSLSDNIKLLLEDDKTTITVNRLVECKEQNLVGVLALAQGSAIEPAVIKVEYKGGNGPLIGLVGKGITFDSGGYNIKSGDFSSMKTDMAGSGAVIGTLKAIIEQQLNVNVVAYLMLADNLINEHAYLPGEILTYNNNVSVEIGNTDAEGRLVLADGLLLMEKEQCDVVIDIATLTGNSATALGKSFAPLYSSNPNISSMFTKSNYITTDNVWPMPLPQEYNKYIEGNISDIRNTSSNKHAGSITAALFLQHFAPSTDWVHIDMGAMSRRSEFGTPVNGYGVRLLTNFIINYSQHYLESKHN